MPRLLPEDVDAQHDNGRNRIKKTKNHYEIVFKQNQHNVDKLGNNKLLKTIVKSLLLNVLWYALGRRNLVRLARFLNNEFRLDVNNDPATNGETMVQSTVL